jgi:hypothetical protein
MRFSSSSKTSQSRLAKISGRMYSLNLGASFAPRMEQAASQIQDSSDLPFGDDATAGSFARSVGRRQGEFGARPSLDPEEEEPSSGRASLAVSRGPRRAGRWLGWSLALPRSHRQ